MNEKDRIIIMKITSTFAVLSFVYPVILVLRGLIFKESGGLEVFLLTLLINLVGFFAAAITVKKKPGIIMFTTFVIPILFAYISFSNFNSSRIIFEIVIAIIIYFIGIYSYLADFDSLNEWKAGLGMFLIAALLVNIFIPISRYILFFGFSFMICTLILLNQSNLDRVFLKMNRQLSNIEKDIRKFNLIMIIIFSIIALLIFNLRKIVAFFLRLIIFPVGRFCVWLYFSIFHNKAVHLLKGAKKGGLNYGGGSGAILGYLFYGILCLFVLVAIIVIFILFRLIFEFSYKSVSKEKHCNEEEYIDEIEELNHEQQESSKQNTKKEMNKRTLKKLKNIKDPNERIRYIYGIVIEKLMQIQIEIKKSDTTGEICKKTIQKQNLNNSLNEITEVYDKVRYGEKPPEVQKMRSIEKSCIDIINIK